ncbi:MAG TPA: hypothetical protein VMB34_24570 [Acetobacteraceae bacterium]|nr:hypothetical protein [Acetobacteraceae bacterium]
MDRRKGEAGQLNGGGFGELVRRAVLYEKRRPAAELAATLSLPPAGLYARLRGRPGFAPEQIAIPLRELPDDHLTRWLFSGSGIMPVRRPADRSDAAGETLIGQAVGSALASVDALLSLLAAFDLPQPDGEAAARADGLAENALAGLLSIKVQAAACRATKFERGEARAARRFAPLAAQVLWREHGVRLHDLALSLGISYGAARARMEDITPFHPAELRHLLRLYPEPRLADFFLAETPFIAMPLPGVSESRGNYGPMHAGMLALREIVRLMAGPASVPTPADNLPDGMEQSLNAALRELMTLRWDLTHLGSHAPRGAVRDGILRGMVQFQADARLQPRRARPMAVEQDGGVVHTPGLDVAIAPSS